MSEQQPDTAPGNYYVTAVDARRTALLAGPFRDDHAAALAHVKRATDLAVNSTDPRAWFYAYGTARLPHTQTRPGIFNTQLGINLFTSDNPGANLPSPNQRRDLMKRVTVKNHPGAIPEFTGKTGTAHKEGKMWRVTFDTPVEVPGVGQVRDDLWEGRFLKTVKS